LLIHSERLTHISGHPSAAGRAWDRESFPVKDQRSTTVQRNQPYCDVCLSVSLSARISQQPHVQTSRNIPTCYLWSWLDPLLRTVKYVMYSGFVGAVVFSHNAASRTESYTMLCLIKFARWRQRGEGRQSCFLRLRTSFSIF